MIHIKEKRNNSLELLQSYLLKSGMYIIKDNPISETGIKVVSGAMNYMMDGFRSASKLGKRRGSTRGNQSYPNVLEKLYHLDSVDDVCMSDIPILWNEFKRLTKYT
jgi:hypothetical protein